MTGDLVSEALRHTAELTTDFAVEFLRVNLLRQFRCLRLRRGVVVRALPWALLFVVARPAAAVVPLVAVFAVVRRFTTTLPVVSRILATTVPVIVVASVGEARLVTSVVAVGALVVASVAAAVAASVVAPVVLEARPVIPTWTVELPIPSAPIIPIVPAPAFVMTPIVVATALVTTIAPVAATVVAPVVLEARPVIPTWTVELPIPSTAIIPTALEPGTFTPTTIFETIAPIVPAPILGTAGATPVVAASALLLTVATATFTALVGVPALPEFPAAILSSILVTVIGSTAGPATALVASVGAAITSETTTPVVGTGHRTS